MGSYIARQPNGLICRHSTVVDCVTHWNMTEKDYVEMCAEKARVTAREVLSDYMQPYQNVIDDFRQQNMTKKEFKKIREIMESKKIKI